MTPREIADRLSALCRDGKYVDAIGELYSADVRQSENRGPFLGGRDAIAAACRAWVESRVVHGTTIVGTHVAADSFVLEMTHDVTPHATKVRHQWSEAGVYRIADGRIAEVVFYYRPPA